jgi:hypothetical protein
MRRLACGVLVVSVLLPSSAHSQGTLQRARQSTYPGPAALPAPSSSSSGDTLRRTDSENGSNWFSSSGEAGGYLILLGLAGVTSPFWGPFLLFDDSYKVPGYFPGYPYGHDDSGYLFVDTDGTRPCDDQTARLGDRDYLKCWSMRMSLENINDFRGLNQVQGQMFVDTTWRVGMLTSWRWLHEDVGGGHSDEAVLMDTNLTFRFAQCRSAVVYAGLGVRMLMDRGDTRGGFNALYGFDFFPAEPMIVSAQVDVGNLAEAFVVHARTTVGWSWGRWEMFGGYDFLRIGGVNLQGPVAGMRMWY